MPQEHTWEEEYKNPKLVTKNAEPQKDVLRFLKFLRKEEEMDLENLFVLDLGSGTGRNTNYMASLEAEATGIEISEIALKLAKERAAELGLSVDYRLGSIGEKYPFESESFDLLLDVTSSNSLNEKEREVYLKESSRVLKKGGYFFVRALCKDGDKNAKELIKNSPGPERDTYTIKEMGLTERVFTEKDFKVIYGKYFKILKLKKKTNYARFKGQSYKRNYWLAYLVRV